jgi:hypothetical protein
METYNIPLQRLVVRKTQKIRI